MMKILSVFGTRPEAIKMAPLMQALAREPNIHSRICVTGQHREMLDPVMALFDLRADHDLNVMVPGQTLNGLYARVMAGVDRVIEEEKPDVILVHGDTSTANASAVSAFHQRVRVGHVEAGLRTYNMMQPYPEEMNRRVVDAVGHWLFAPTQTSRENLMSEQLSGRIIVTGNTVIDALALTCRTLETDPVLASAFAQRYDWIDPNRRLVLVTGHRRENFGDGFEQICQALTRLSERQDIQIVYPVHMNPAVRGVVERSLSGLDHVHLIQPLSYPDFVWFMLRAHIILTDSGGVQEEAPSLGKPVLVMRNVTERPEAVAAGTVTLVGTDTDHIVAEVNDLLDNEAHYLSICGRVNPYGDGNASDRIVAALCERSFTEFNPLPLLTPLAAAA